MHYTLTVTGDNLEKQLEPFQEYDGQSYLDKYVSFKDCTDEVLSDWETGTSLEYYITDTLYITNTLYSLMLSNIGIPPNQWMIRINATKYNRCDIGHVYKCYPELGSTGVQLGNLYVRVIAKVPNIENVFVLETVPGPRRIPNIEIYPDLFNFVKEYFGENYILKDGRWGYMTNVNGKWDWWVIGGRWGNKFRLKSGCKCINIGEEYVSHDKQLSTIDTTGETYCDSVRLCDIDLEYMEKDICQKTGEIYDAFHAKMKKDIARFKTIDNFTECTRKDYYEQDLFKQRRKHPDEHWYPVESYLLTREEFIEMDRLCSLCTFAYLHDGVWIDRDSFNNKAAISLDVRSLEYHRHRIQ